jgi:predicted nucleic acid-binding protein
VGGGSNTTKVVTIALAAFGLAYACLWWSFQRFYGAFGVSPQDVGLSPSGSAADLPGAALQLGIWLLLALTLLAVVPALAVAAAEIGAALRRSTKKGSDADAWIAFAVAVLLAAGAGGLYWWLVGGVQGLATIGIAAIAFAALQYGLPRALKPIETAAPSKRAPEVEKDLVAGGLRRIGAPERLAPRLRFAFGIFFAAAVIGIAFLDLPNDALEAASCAAHGYKAVPSLNVPVPYVHLPILSVHAQPASLVWLTSGHPPVAPSSRFVYLGQAAGSDVVYDVLSRRTTRIPADAVIVSVHTAATNCPGVH